MQEYILYLYNVQHTINTWRCLKESHPWKEKNGCLTPSAGEVTTHALDMTGLLKEHVIGELLSLLKLNIKLTYLQNTFLK